MSHRGALALVIVGVFAGSAYADEMAPVEEGEEAEEPKLIPSGKGGKGSIVEERKDHHKQFGFGLQIPIGMRAIKTWDDEDYCGKRGEDGDPNAPVCVARNPQTFDFEFAYGIKRNLELMMELRVGLERDFAPTSTSSSSDGPRLFHWSPGAKFYFSDAGVSKLFTTAQIAFDFTGYEDASGDARGVDIILRNVNGLQLDLNPSYGLYVFIGEELAFKRWLMFGIEAGIGIQGRYP